MVPGMMTGVNAYILQRIIFVAITKRSSKTLTGKSIPHSEKDAVALSTPSDTPLQKEIVIQVLCLVLEKLIYETCSADKLYLAFASVKDKIEKMDDAGEALRAFNKLVLMAEGIRKKNPFHTFF